MVLECDALWSAFQTGPHRSVEKGSTKLSPSPGPECMWNDASLCAWPPWPHALPAPNEEAPPPTDPLPPTPFGGRPFSSLAFRMRLPPIRSMPAADPTLRSVRPLRLPRLLPARRGLREADAGRPSPSHAAFGARLASPPPCTMGVVLGSAEAGRRRVDAARRRRACDPPCPLDAWRGTAEAGRGRLLTLAACEPALPVCRGEEGRSRCVAGENAPSSSQPSCRAPCAASMSCRALCIPSSPRSCCGLGT